MKIDVSCLEILLRKKSDFSTRVVSTVENERFNENVREVPGTSVRSIDNQQGIPKSTVWKIFDHQINHSVYAI